MEIWTPTEITNPIFDGFLEPLPSEKSWRGQPTKARMSGSLGTTAMPKFN
jgi:hypothetical protein